MNEKKVKNALQSIFEKYEIDKVWLFGSFLTGNYDDNSDIDIVYERSQSFGFDDELNIFNFINDLQDNSLNREVDVTNIKNIQKNSKISNTIKQEMVLIYNRGE